MEGLRNLLSREGISVVLNAGPCSHSSIGTRTVAKRNGRIEGTRSGLFALRLQNALISRCIKSLNMSSVWG
ncbi:hypothetical protein TNCV_4805031 [Trichonephila clavipes]|nr:hypothetical protein TNCV_4805031 [Trichonephila clavipes]